MTLSNCLLLVSGTEMEHVMMDDMLTPVIEEDRSAGEEPSIKIGMDNCVGRDEVLARRIGTIC